MASWIGSKLKRIFKRNEEVSPPTVQKVENSVTHEANTVTLETTPPSTGVSVPPNDVDTDSSDTMEEDSTSEESPNESLWNAALYGDISGMMSAIDEGAVVDWGHPALDGWTALHEAARSGKSVTVALLLECGSSVHVVDEYGCTPLHYAKDAQVAQMLLRHGASVDVIDKDGNTCLHTSSEHTTADAVAFFISKGLDISATNNACRTPMHMAAQNEHSCKEVVSLLLKEGARVDTVDNDGVTPLHILQQDAHKEAKHDVNNVDIVNKQRQECLLMLKNDFNMDFLDAVKDLNEQSITPDKQTSQHSVLAKDYNPYLEAAAKDGTIKSKRTGYGVIGASGTGKSSLIDLFLNNPPVLKHCSTPVVRPLKGIWLISRYNQWKEQSSDLLAQSIAGSVWKRMEDLTTNTVTHNKDEQFPKNTRLVSTGPLHSGSLPTLLVSSTAQVNPSPTYFLDLPATKQVADILKSGRDYESLQNLHFVNVTDSGGQAPFIDIAPSLYPYSSINLVVCKLNESLESEVNFYYSIDGQLVGSEKRNTTTKQLITAAVSSKAKIQMPQIKGVVCNKSNEKPQNVVIGTHYDEYLRMKQNKEKMESLEDKNECLEIALKDFEDVLISNGANTIFPLNALSRDEEAQSIADRIRKLASQCYTEVEVPVKWYLFQIAIEEMKSKGRSVIPFSTFEQLGGNHHMTADEIKAALEYFHDLNICLYYPHVLPGVVFTSPQYLFDLISKLMAISFHETSVTCNVTLTKATIRQLKNGIFKKDLLASFFLDDNCYADDFLKLICHLYIATPLSDPDTYFMPCLLQSCDHPTDGMREFQIKPLLFTWNNVVPHGLFTSLVSYLIQSRALCFQLDKSQPQYRNKLMLICTSFQCQVVMFECPAFIGLATNLSIKEVEEVTNVRGAIQKGMQVVLRLFRQEECLTEKRCAFLCECDLEYPHMCSCDDKGKFMTCSVNTGLRVEQTDSHRVWFGCSKAPDSALKVNDIVLDPTDNSVLPIPLPAQSIDVLNAKVSPGVSAKYIFVRQSANLADAFSTDPIKFAGEFAAVNLITPTKVDDLSTRSSLSNLEKATQLVSALHVNLKIDNNPKLLLTICEVLKKHKSHALDTIVINILEQLGNTTIK